MRNTQCLVTGGAGFIGSHLVSRLLTDGARVTVLDDFSSGFEENLKPLASKQLNVIRGSVTDRADVERALHKAEYVFHLAARPSVVRSIEDPWTSHEVNITGTMILLEQCRKLASLKRFVFTSSSSVYGNTPTLPKSEEMAGNVLSPYALQKWTGESYVRLYHDLYGFPGLSIRPFNVFGPRQAANSDYAAVIPKFITAAISHAKIPIFGDGNQTRDFTPVENLVHIFLLAAQTKNERALGQAYNGGAGGRASVKNLAESIIKLAGSRSKIDYQKPRPGDIRDSFADLKKAESELGYKPVLGFEEGLKNLIAHYRKASS